MKFRIGIRQQLIALVLMVALFSLMVLAIITGVYFSQNYKNIRADRLEVIAQMKASQVQQSLNGLYYQAYWLTTREQLQTSLVSYRAGNTSDSNWSAARQSIQQFLSSTYTFAAVSLYDTKAEEVVRSSPSWSNLYVPDDVLDEILPLSDPSYEIPPSLDTQGVITGPVLNDTSYVMSMTLPIFATASIIVSTTNLAGYITMVMTAQSLVAITELKDADVVLLRSLEPGDNSSNATYGFVLPPAFEREDSIDDVFEMKNNDLATQVLQKRKKGSFVSTANEKGEKIAAGYCPVVYNMTNWGVAIEQSKSVFFAPSRKLTKIIVGVCIGTAVFLGIVTFPLAHWAVKPILRLQKATETIAQGRGLQTGNHKRDPSSGVSSGRGSFGSYRYRGGNSTENVGTRTNSFNNASNSNTDNEHGPYPGGMHESTYIGNARVPKYSRFFEDELSKLTDTFNTMTDDLDRQYSQLEDRVRARTKQLEAAKIQAEAANEAKTVFIANISHELRTPLNGILGMTAIAMTEKDQDKIQDSLKLIFRSGELLLHILTELLTFSKNSLKRSKLEKSDFTTMEVALQVKSIFGKLAKDQNVNLKIILRPNDIRKMVLYGDSNRIIQVVMNLVSNSLKFTPVDGNVTVTIRCVGEYDEERSEAEEFKAVYIKAPFIPADEKPSPQATTSNLDTRTKIEIPEYYSTSSNNTTPVSGDESDKKSIMTVSTSSYDDNFFKSQFKISDYGDENALETTDIPEKKTWVFEFVVEDTGPGIDPKLQSSVFQPFVQGDQTLSRQYGGTGLGLSICQQLAGMMNGVMELKSEVGVGSKFTFRVPLLQTKELVLDDSYEDEFNANRKKKVKIIEPPSEELQHNQNEPPQEPRTPGSATGSKEETGYFDRPMLQSTGTAKTSSIYSFNSNSSPHVDHPLKVLVAEDNGVNQEVIKRMLNFEGLTDIDLAIDGEEAIQYVKSQYSDENAKPYDIIFMDVQMPKCDGLQATKTIRSMNFTGPIVALTAFADESNVKECLDAGMSGFLSKPIRRPQVRKVLSEFCPIILKEIVTTPSTSSDGASRRTS